jgi:hypothetical protein
MTVRLGIFLIWLFLALPWCGFIAGTAYKDYGAKPVSTNIEVPADREECKDPNADPIGCVDEEAIEVPSVQTPALIYFGEAVGGSMFLLAFMGVIGWAISEFRRDLI